MSPSFRFVLGPLIGKCVWKEKGDIREVISIGKLVRKGDGPEDVLDLIVTMYKYSDRD